MTSTIVLKSSNITDKNTNAVFKYDFPNSVNLIDHEVALISASMYYSWNNISTVLENRTFQYQYVDGTDTLRTVTVTLDEGLYEISDINKALQFSMINEGLYLTNNDENVYYLEFVINTVRNSVDINTYSVPTSLPDGFTAPSNWPGYPSVSYNPNLIIPSKFNEIIGYADGFQTGLNTGNNTTLSFSSSVSPNVQPNSNLLIDVGAFTDNRFSNPAGVIASIVPSVNVGALINVKPPEYVYSPIKNGIYSSVTVRLLNAFTLQPQEIQDPSIVIILGIRKKYSFEIPTDRY